MRKVIFKINDQDYFRKEFEKDGCTRKQTDDLLKGVGNFKAIYTLYGEGKNVNRYELTDYDENKININDLNGYEKGVVLNDCYAYFTGGKYHCNEDKPCGVVEIIEV